MEINVNTQVRVTLTKAGARCLNADREDYPELFSDVVEGDTYECILWELMNIFGPDHHCGGEPLFNRNIIILTEIH